jgi:serine/threonine-protein phosphatase 2B catalytic subunit
MVDKIYKTIPDACNDRVVSEKECPTLIN